MLGKREGKRTLGGPGHRWEGNIKWIWKKYSEKICSGLILDQDRYQWCSLVGTAMNFGFRQVGETPSLPEILLTCWGYFI
jgi:hypothetical protein